MALDGAFLYAVKQELDVLIGGRIDKIYQPSREEIIISIRTRQGGFKLLISASASSARIHITHMSVDNPMTPPMFCMLLLYNFLEPYFLSPSQILQYISEINTK